MRSARLPAIVAAAAAAVSLTLTAPAASASVVDPARKPSASFNGTVHAVAASGNTIFVAGTFTGATDAQGTYQRRRLAAVNATTGRILPWNPGADRAVYAIDVFRNSVVIGGAFTRAGGRPANRLAKLSAITGRAASGFRASANKSVKAVEAKRERVYVGGNFTTMKGKPRARLAAVSRSNGALTKWNPRASATVRTIAATGKRIYVGGFFQSINGARSAGAIAALNKAGGLARAFNPKLKAPVFDIHRAGKRVYAAAGGNGGRLVTFGLQGGERWRATFDGDVSAVTAMHDSIYAGGHYNNICTSMRVAPGNGDCLDGSRDAQKLTAFSLDGRHRTAWNPRPDSALGVAALAVRPKTHTLAAGGAFQRVGAAFQPGFALFR